MTTWDSHADMTSPRFQSIRKRRACFAPSAVAYSEYFGRELRRSTGLRQPHFLYGRIVVAITANCGAGVRHHHQGNRSSSFTRLAVDHSYRGRALGRAFVRDAVERVSHAADGIGIRGILVHAISDEAKKFYLALGFDPCAGEPMTLVVTLSDIRAALP
jgi:GNAT superfamily N-acetyltransferase